MQRGLKDGKCVRLYYVVTCVVQAVTYPMTSSTISLWLTPAPEHSQHTTVPVIRASERLVGGCGLYRQLTVWVVCEFEVLLLPFPPHSGQLNDWSGLSVSPALYARLRSRKASCSAVNFAGSILRDGKALNCCMGRGCPMKQLNDACLRRCIKLEHSDRCMVDA